jgi:hypothetical protein
MLPTDADQVQPPDPAPKTPGRPDLDHEFSAQDDLEVPLDEPDLPAVPLADDEEPSEV